MHALKIRSLCSGGAFSSSSRSDGSPKQRMKVKYHLTYDKSTPFICHRAFCNAYGITNYLRKRLSREVKEGLFHLSSNKQEFHPHNVVDKEALKEIKAMLKQSNIKFPKSLEVNMELPNSVSVLKVKVSLYFLLQLFYYKNYNSYIILNFIYYRRGLGCPITSVHSGVLIQQRERKFMLTW